MKQFGKWLAALAVVTLVFCGVVLSAQAASSDYILEVGEVEEFPAYYSGTRFFDFTTAESGNYSLTVSTVYDAGISIAVYENNPGSADDKRIAKYYHADYIARDLHLKQGTCHFQAEANKTYIVHLNLYTYDHVEDTSIMNTIRLEKTGKPTGVCLSDVTVEGYKYETLQLPYWFEPLWSEEAVTWQSDDPSIVSVTDTGEITMRSPGQTTVRVTGESGITASCTVVVKDVHGTLSAGSRYNIALKPGEMRVYAFTPEEDGEYIFFDEANEWGATHFLPNYRKDYDSRSSWTSQLSKGQTYLVGVQDGKFTLGVEKVVPIEKIEIVESVSSDYIPVRETFYGLHSEDIMFGELIHVRAYPEWLNLCYNLKVDWYSSDYSVIDMNYYGNDQVYIYKRGYGTATITAVTEDGIEASVEVTVLEHPEDEIYCGESRTVTPDPYGEALYYFTAPEDGTYVVWTPRGEQVLYEKTGTLYENTLELEWTRFDGSYSGYGYSNPFSEDDYVGDYIYMSEGDSVWIDSNCPYENYTSYPVSGTFYIDKLEPPEKIRIQSEQDVYYVGDTGCEFTCLPETVPQVMLKGTAVNWSSSDETVMRKNQYGSWEAVGEGTTVITAELDNGATASYTVRVLQPPAISVGEEKTVTLAPGQAVCYSFTPEEEGTYILWTESEKELGDLDLRVLRYNSYVYQGTYVEGYQGIRITAWPGNTYLLQAVNPADASGPVTKTLHFSKLEDPENIRIIARRPEWRRNSNTYRDMLAYDFDFVGESGCPFILSNITCYWDDTELTQNYKQRRTFWQDFYSETFVLTATLPNGASASMEVTIPGTIDSKEYTVTEGNEAVVIKGKEAPLTFRLEGSSRMFLSARLDNVRELNEGEYTADAESMTVTLHPDILKTLEPGEHIVEISLYEGVAYATFTVQEDSTYLPGDINGDGKLNNKDASRLFQHLSGWDVEVIEAALDINGDGKVNNKDASRLFQYLSGWSVEIH